MYFLAVLCFVAVATALPAPDQVHADLQEPLSSPGPFHDGNDKKEIKPIEKEDRVKEALDGIGKELKKIESESMSKESAEEKNSKAAEISKIIDEPKVSKGSKESEELKKFKDEEPMLHLNKDDRERPDEPVLVPMNDEQKRGLLSSFLHWIKEKFMAPLPSWRRMSPDFEEKPYYIIEEDPYDEN